jgi:uncharacterized protein YpuA (DUF1002 family)
MSLTKLTENMNNVQSLADKPVEAPEILKQVFDKAGNDIKSYINDTLTTQIDALISNLQSGKIDTNKIVNDVTTGGSTYVASAEIVKSLNARVDTILSDVDTKIQNLGLKSGATTQITSGTATPSGGNDGDVYIQYF